MKLALVGIAAISLLTSCADGASPHGQDGVHKVAAASLISAQSMAQNAEVTCAPGEKCSLSVGLVTSSEADGAGQCTGTLVGPNLVATNAHCVPADITEGASCENRIWITFADAPGFEKRIGCRVVLKKKKSKDVDNQIDYAFLQLSDISKRPPLRISRLGVSNGMNLRVEKVDPADTPGRITGTQSIAKCQAIQHTLIYASFSNDYTSSAFFTGCEIMAGNSGSPILAPDNTVRGVLFARFDPSGIAEVLKGSKYLLPDSPAPANLATNFACLEVPPAAGAGAPPFTCAFPRSRNLSLANREESIRLYAQQIVNLLAARNSFMQAFEWGYSVEDNSQIRLKPTCFKNGLMAAGSKLVGPLSWDIETKLDRYYRFEKLSLTKSSREEMMNISSAFDGSMSVAFLGGGRAFETQRLNACK
jgi:hypothetical protein